jgi:hypothetical protein
MGLTVCRAKVSYNRPTEASARAGRKVVTSRIEWLKLQNGGPLNLCRRASQLAVFEVYYQLCALRGYRPRHVFLNASPESLRATLPGDHVLLIWPRLPLSIRLLEVAWPYAYGSHAEGVPYTPEAFAAAKAAGRRVRIILSAPGEFKKARQETGRAGAG